MKIEINQVELPLEYSEEDIIAALAHKLSCQANQILSWTIKRRSLDARPIRKAPVYSAIIYVEVSNSYKPTFKGHDFTILKDTDLKNEYTETKFSYRPVIVGAGIAGLMAAYYLAKSGAQPIIIERGNKAELRSIKVNNFWEKGILDLNNNVLFGEGGAGLFSDGKLTARSKDKGRIFDFYNILRLCKAPEEIFINAEPHLGSDVLLKIIPNLRKHIESLGGSFFYDTTMTDIEMSNGCVSGVITNKSKFETKAVILATGHSARDVYKLLSEKNIELEQKPFAIGIRLELPQEQINAARYRKFKDHPNLEPASFKLTRLPEKN
ncbi:MAG: FAD-dependent oxidoreductase, partial [Candidatus Riflebacteria bacterium]|nr:FAD-dependent oxidoreductase [Candidatus Riflebacteria bacterium]